MPRQPPGLDVMMTNTMTRMKSTNEKRIRRDSVTLTGSSAPCWPRCGIITSFGGSRSSAASTEHGQADRRWPAGAGTNALPSWRV